MSTDQAALAHGLAWDHECLVSWSPRAKAAGAFARRKEEPGPKAVADPRIDLDEPFAGATFKKPTRRERSPTTNAIERHLGEAGRGPP